ncbi:MAG: helix-turn-helix transcriptional regulator [Coriobacteriales bacterium]|nr:helix-turn-helix transcriptional regulator [Coriobacteriales bacterium]
MNRGAKIKSTDSFPDVDALSRKSGFIQRIRSLSFLGLGFYWAWIYYCFFGGALFQTSFQPQSYALTAQLFSFLAYVAMMLIASLKQQPTALLKSRVVNCLAPITASAGTLLIVIGCSSAGSTYSGALIISGSVMTGFGTGHLLMLWGYRFISSSPELIPLRIVFSLLSSILVYFILTVLPAVADATLCSILPLLSFLACLAARDQTQSKRNDALQPKHRVAFPFKLGFALAGAGMVAGWCMGLSLVSEVGFQSLIMVVVNSVLAIIVFLYSVLTGKNFGFSSGFLIILPVVGIALVLMALSPSEYTIVAFFLIRFGYSLFDILIWLQMPRVFTRTQSLHLFAFSRFCLDGGALLGVVLVHLLTAFDILHSSMPVQIIAISLIAFVNLAFTLNKQDFESSWSLLPVLRSEAQDFDYALKRVALDFALSPREMEIMAMIARGRSASYVHTKLGIALSTVQTHTKNGYRKLGVHSRQELLSLIEQQMDRPDPDLDFDSGFRVIVSGLEPVKAKNIPSPKSPSSKR